MTYNDALDTLRYGVSLIDAEEQAAYLRLETRYYNNIHFMLMQLDERGRPTFADCSTSIEDVRALAMWLDHRTYGPWIVSAGLRERLLASDSWIVADFYEIARRIRSGL